MQKNENIFRRGEERSASHHPPALRWELRSARRPRWPWRQKKRRRRAPPPL